MISFVVPACNEAAQIREVVDAARRSAAALEHQPDTRIGDRFLQRREVRPVR